MDRQSILATFALIKSDMQYRCDYEHKTLTALRVVGFMFNHAVLSQIIYRFQTFFYTHGLSFIGAFLKGLNSIVFTVTIDPSACIGGAWLLLHPNYIHVGKKVIIGKNCIMTQQISIGPSYIWQAVDGEQAHIDLSKGPVLGDNVLLGVGCAIFGDISIGSHSKVSVNTAVDKSFPENATLVGVPAKNLRLS
jgi:serine O-acetyltransferase